MVVVQFHEMMLSRRCPVSRRDRGCAWRDISVFSISLRIAKVVENLRVTENAGSVPKEIGVLMLPVAFLLTILSGWNVVFGFSIGQMKELETFDFLGRKGEQGTRTGRSIFSAAGD